MYINKFITTLVLITVCLLILTSPTTAEQFNFLRGKWEGSIFLADSSIKIEVYFENTNDKKQGIVNVPALEVINQPLKINKINNSKITFVINNKSTDMLFEGNFSSNKIKGTFSQKGKNEYNFVLKRDSNNNKQVELKGSEQQIKIPVKGGDLEAILTYPQVHNISDPVAIIIAGSGPTDRNGNSPLVDYQINNLKYISYFLANNGIISIRYDKRGVGESKNLVDNKTPTFTQYKDDILQVIDYVNNNLGRKNPQIFLVGHSEGSTLAIMAAQNMDKLGGIVLLSSPGFKQEVLLKRQLKRQNEILYNQGRIQEKNLLVRTLDELIKAIEQDNKFSLSEYNIPDNYKSIYKSLNNQRDFSKEWLKTSPAKILKTLDLPTCIVQGGDDQQIKKENAERLSSVVSKDNLSLNYIKGVNHLLLEDNNKISEEVLKTITEFIKKYK
jgi:hypothetical protein